jgi:hypothetical protein
MAKKTKKAGRLAFKVVLRPEDGGVGENGRPLVRIMEVFSESEAGAREYATEQALGEHQEHGSPLYVIESVEAV